MRARLTRMVLLWLLAAPGLAQGQVIRGRLIDDETDRGIDGGIMSLMLGERVVDRILSDSTGAFALFAPAVGVYSVTVQRIGYREARSALLELELGDTLTVEYRVLPEAILLEPMLVVAISRAGRGQFMNRMAAGIGQFVTRDMLDSLDLWHVGMIFREVEGFNLSWDFGIVASSRSTGTAPTGNASGMIPRIRSYLGRGCVAYMVDGVRGGARFRSEAGTNPWALYPLDTLQEDDIMGMEFYRYIGEVPEELRYLASGTWYTGSMCGLVMIWTRARW